MRHVVEVQRAVHGRLGEPGGQGCRVRRPGSAEGVPDGIEVDDKGNLYVAAADVYVFTPKGEKIGLIHLAEKPSNLAFGDGDLKSLYVTARTTLYRVRLEAKGVSLY